MSLLQPLFVLALAAFPALAFAQSSSPFFSPPTYAGSECVAADLNGDGKPDLVCEDGTVQLGNGDGTFTHIQSWTTNQQLVLGNFLLTGDFNGDGIPDLLVPPSSGGTSTSIYILLGKGDGTFQSAISTNIGTTLFSAVVVDANGDGKPDVVATTVGLGLAVFLGRGDGTFTTGFSTATLGGNGLIFADFNQDGKVDVAVPIPGSGSTSTTINVFLGNGDGTFRTPVSTSISVQDPVSIAAADVNGDNKVDIVVSDFGDSQVLLGNGDGTFQTLTPLTVGGYLAVKDINGDGKPDLIVEDGFVEAFLGNGDGTFTFKSAYFQNSGGPVLAADFNLDSKPDIAVGNEILLGNGDGTFEGNVAMPGFPGFSTAVGDFNGDGVPDFALLSPQRGCDNSISIASSDGTGKLTITHTYSLPVPGCSVATADMNADGKLDLVVQGIDPTTNDLVFEVLLGNGDGTFGSVSSYPQTFSILDLGVTFALADFNGDGRADIGLLITGGFGSSDVYVLLNNGNGFAAPVSYFSGSGTVSFVLGDFNNDGKLDIATGSSAGTGILFGNGDGTFQAAKFSNSIPGQQQIIQAAADLNRDGKTDLVTNLGIFLGNGDGTFNLAGSNQLSNTRVADLNGDGIPDLIGVRLDPTQLDTVVAWQQLTVQLGNGDGTFGNPIVVLQVPPPKESLLLIEGIADLNADSKPDLLAYVGGFNPGNGPDGLVTLLNTSGPPSPDYAVSATAVTPSSVSPGGSASSNITVSPVGGFNGTVVLSCTGLPSGANCVFSPASLNSSGTSALTITTTASLSAGAYSFVINASSGTILHYLTSRLTIAPPGPATLTLAPNSLSFSQESIGGFGSPEILQVTNTGSAGLIVSNVSIAGPNAADFSQTNTCTSMSPISPSASCQISVSFSPVGTGQRTANVSVTDNASGSPQLIPLSGTGPDFSVGTPVSSVTVSAGQTATYTLNVSPSAGFNETLNFTCNGAPLLATCTVSPSSIQLNGTTSISMTVAVATTAPSSSSIFFISRRSRGKWTSGPICLFGIFLMLTFSLWCVHRSGWTERRWRRFGYSTTVCLLAIGLCSCGGGAGSSPGTGNGNTNPGTQSGSYTILVTGTSTDANPIAHSQTLTLIIR